MAVGTGPMTLNSSAHYKYENYFGTCKLLQLLFQFTVAINRVFLKVIVFSNYENRRTVSFLDWLSIREVNDFISASIGFLSLFVQRF